VEKVARALVRPWEGFGDFVTHWMRQAPGSEDDAPEIDTTKPNVARMYDAMLGGKDNFAADRAAVEQLTAQVPKAPQMAQSNRAFHQRAAAWMAERGIRQFIDVGAGLPTRDNTHEVVERINPACLVVYVDIDPVVLAHARALLSHHDHGVAVIGADMRDPESILGHDVVRNLIDFDAPCGVLMTGLWHFISDEADPQGLMAQYVSAVAPGSCFALTQATADDRRPQEAQGAVDGYKGTSQGLHMRTRAQFTAMFAGLEIVPPGVVLPDEWPSPDTGAASPTVLWGYAGMAVKAG
jgi:O-methyltransferase involved in polyketide biosynthesis